MCECFYFPYTVVTVGLRCGLVGHTMVGNRYKWFHGVRVIGPSSVGNDGHNGWFIVFLFRVNGV